MSDYREHVRAIQRLGADCILASIDELVADMPDEQRANLAYKAFMGDYYINERAGHVTLLPSGERASIRATASRIDAPQVRCGLSFVSGEQLAALIRYAHEEQASRAITPRSAICLHEWGELEPGVMLDDFHTCLRCGHREAV